MLALFFAVTANAFAFDEAPLNPKFVDWLAEKNAPMRTKSTVTSESNQPPLTYRPSPLDRSGLLDKSIAAQTSAIRLFSIPVVTEASYDLRDLGRITAVRDQGVYGTCWAFASLASSESSTLTQGGSTDDYSEKHLAYYGYVDIDSEYVGFDMLLPQDEQAYEGSVYDEGGNSDMSTALLSRWNGIVAESTVPYADMGPTKWYPALPAGTVPASGATNKMMLTDTHFAPGGSNVVNNIKYLLKTYGAVHVSIYWNSFYLNSTTGGFYYGVNEATNHAVTVVGWDDSYSKNNFNTTPNNDGAWIVRNSWGSSWGSDVNQGGDWGGAGYFYVSYEDRGVSQGGTAFQTGAVQEGRHMYLHDYLGNNRAGGGGDGSEWMANFFTVTENQNIVQVALFTLSTDTTVDVYIVRNATFSGNVIAGDGSDQIRLTSTIVTPGYHTLTLPSSVPVSAGETFAVMVNVKSTAANPLPMEGPIEDYSSRAKASAGQSYYSDDGAYWEDLTGVDANNNFCVRAIAEPRSVVLAPINLLLLN